MLCQKFCLFTMHPAVLCVFTMAVLCLFTMLCLFTVATLYLFPMLCLNSMLQPIHYFPFIYTAVSDHYIHDTRIFIINVFDRNVSNEIHSVIRKSGKLCCICDINSKMFAQKICNETITLSACDSIN